jgi:hypothetical protein
VKAEKATLRANESEQIEVRVPLGTLVVDLHVRYASKTSGVEESERAVVRAAEPHPGRTPTERADVVDVALIQAVAQPAVIELAHRVTVTREPVEVKRP